MKKNKLSEKQKAFCDIYIKNGGKNGAQAAREAGYKARTDKAFGNIANKNLQLPHIKAYIADFMQKIESDRIASVDEALQIVSSIARGEVGEADNKAPPAFARLKAAEIILRVNGKFDDKLTVKADSPIVLAGDNLV